ncbi:MULTISPECIES: hypothetical protein [Chitinilyticum]|uniref:Uncharacterized protein n=1 Tax=Chitinilyticum piscinae TaxID=2866724 RepID=A0A8J7FIS8_9NEIS|nr:MULTISPECIES: hypothetical protein [Chitinilyticum]MBE9607739.1 hypothetical protein [Chitinilyticum piscinae]
MHKQSYFFVLLGFLALIGAFGNLAHQPTPLGTFEYVYNDISYVGGLAWLLPLLALTGTCLGFLRVFKWSKIPDLRWWSVLFSIISLVVLFIVQVQSVQKLNEYASIPGSSPGWGAYLQWTAYLLYFVYSLRWYSSEANEQNGTTDTDGLSSFIINDFIPDAPSKLVKVALCLSCLLTVLVFEAPVIQVSLLNKSVGINISASDWIWASYFSAIQINLIVLALIFAPARINSSYLFSGKTACIVIAIAYAYIWWESKQPMTEELAIQKEMVFQTTAWPFLIVILVAIIATSLLLINKSRKKNLKMAD